MRRTGKNGEPDRRRSGRGRQRLDQALLERGLAESRTSAQSLILAGEVRVDGELAVKPSQMVSAETRLEVVAPPRFVSRGGLKLEAALEAFDILVEDKTCADIGASTGGFTDCLLQHGARTVYAVDVGKGILHWKLRQDARVVVLETTNARYLEALPEPIDVVTIDVSFIALALLLPRVSDWLTAGRDVVALIKPQFEAGRAAVGRGGVVRDPAVHREVIQRVVAAAETSGLGAQGVIRSPLRGPSGNIEFLLWAKKGAGARPLADAVERALEDETVTG